MVSFSIVLSTSSAILRLICWQLRITIATYNSKIIKIIVHWITINMITYKRYGLIIPNRNFAYTTTIALFIN